MTSPNVAQEAARGLPQVLRTAQKAIRLPKVEKMLLRLSEYHLGICMPHIHDDRTGGFQPLADEVIQGGIRFGSVLPAGGRNCRPDRSLSPRGMVLARRCVDTLGRVRNGSGGRTRRYTALRQTHDVKGNRGGASFFRQTLGLWSTLSLHSAVPERLPRRCVAGQ